MSNKAKKSIKPKAKVFYDGHEATADKYLEAFKEQQKKKRNPELLNKASQAIKQSKNPEAEEIAHFLNAWYLREKGLKEKDHKKACKLLIKSYTAFNKDKRSAELAKKILLEFYKRKIEQLHEEKRNPGKTFLKKAILHKELGQTEAFHIEMSLHLLFSATNNLKDLTGAIKKISEGIEHAKEAGKEDIVYKLEGILHKLKSHVSTTPQEAIRELEAEIKAIEKTSDKYGRETALGDLSFVRAKTTPEPGKRAKLLEEAAKYYEKAGMTQRAHQLMGDAYQIRGNTSDSYSSQHSDYYLKASQEYEKAGNVRMQKWLEGHHEIALATKLGVLGGDNEEFRKHLMAANHLYKDAGNVGGIQFTAGIGIFLEAIRAEYPQSLELFKSAAECLDSVKEHYLSAFAKSEIARIMASKAKTQEERDGFMLEEKNNLERALIEDKKRKTPEKVTFPVDGVMVSPKVLTSLSKARLHELDGFLEEDREVAKAHFKKAKQEYLSLDSTGAYRILVLSGLGWTSLFLEDISGAKEYFESLKQVNPASSHVKLGLEALDELIKVKYSQESESYLIRQRLSTPLLISLANDVSLVKDGKPYPTGFFNICLVAVKRSCSQIERFKGDFLGAGEQSLRNKILMISNSIMEAGLGSTLTGETFTSQGKSDLFAKNSQAEDDYFIGESKIWSSPSGYKTGFNQLVKRYLTATDRAGLLINFVKKGTISEVRKKAVEAVKEIDGEALIHNIDNKNFVSEHKEQGIIFHHLVDLIPEKED